jgi:hypothetical protein
MTSETKWQRAGFNSEKEYDDHIDEKMAKINKQLKELEVSLYIDDTKKKKPKKENNPLTDII